MTVTSANPDDLQTFITGSENRSGRLESAYSTARTKSSSVMANSSFHHPDTPSLEALDQLLTTWRQNKRFVSVIREELLAANTYDADGNAVVANAVIDATLKARGLDRAPDLVEVDAIQMYGQPPYSGWVDDPISLANGNFLLRDGDIQLFGVAALVSVVRTYNSRDPRSGAFGLGWSSMVDVSLDVADGRISFRGPDGGGAVFRRHADGRWTFDTRRRLCLEELDDGWLVREGHERTWRFDAAGTCTGLTGGGAEVRVEYSPAEVRLTERVSGRWVAYTRDPGVGMVTSVETSDGRRATYRYDDHDRLIGVERDRGDVAYEVDDHGFLAAVVDADGILVCRNTYDADGRVLTQVEHHGRETAYEYRPDGVATVTATDGAPPNVMVHDRRGRMTAMIDGLGTTMRIAYDDRDDIVQIVDRAGAVTRYAHDERGNLVEQVDPDGLTQRWEWDDADRLLVEVDRAGHATRLTYDGDRRLPSRILSADGAETRFTYGDLDLPTTVVDPDGVTVQLEWNRDGLLEAIVDGLGDRVAFSYDRAGRSVGVAAPDVRATVGLDRAGRVRTLRSGSGEQHFEHTAAGRVVGGLDERNRRWRAVLDAAGDVETLADSEGELLRHERDRTGRVTATIAPDGAPTAYEHDPVGRRTAVLDAEGGRTSIGYDPEGRPLLYTDPSGRTWSRELDELGQPTMEVAPDGATSIRSYHPNGELASVTDAAGNEWTYEVDPMGRVVRATDPLGGTTTYRYTPGGRLAEITTPAGRTERREHDDAGREIRIVEPDGTVIDIERAPGGAVRRVLRDGTPTTSYSYDEGGRASDVVGPWGALSGARVAGDLVSLTRGGVTSRFERDPRGLLERVIDPAGVVTEFVHDRCGRLVAATTEESSSTYEWDRAGRLVAANDPYGNRLELERDARGVVERILRPDGSATGWTFDAAGRLAGVQGEDGRQLLEIRRDGTGAVVGARTERAFLELTHDVLGHLLEVTTDVGTVRYRRDPDGAVLALGDEVHGDVGVERDETTAVTGFALPDGRHLPLPGAPRVTRDDHGRIVVDEQGRRFAYDDAGRLAEATVNGITTTYGYDERGLLASERTGDAVRTYRYGRAGEPVAVAHQDGSETTFEHDSLGRRVREVGSDGSTVAYGWDELGRLATVTRTAADGTVEATRIEHDPAGRPMRVDGVPVLWDAGVTGNVLGIGDERYLWWGGQVRSATDPAGTWDRRVTDDPWGDDGGSGVRLGYRGELALDGLLFLGARIYDTRTRSFLSRDPLPAVPGAVAYAGTYTYAWCDPVNLVDPSGMRPLSDQDYDAWREQNTKGFFRKEPGTWILKGVVAVTGAIVMVGATMVLGPAGLVVAGAIVGGLSAGINAKIDGKDWGETGRDVLLGAAMGGLTGPLGRFVPASGATSMTTRLAQNAAINAPISFAQATGAEAASSYVPLPFGPEGDGRMDWDNVLVETAIGTTTGAVAPEITRGIGNQVDRAGDRMFGDLDDGLRQAFRNETPDSLLPNPVHDTTLDINSASSADLQRVNGIGQTLADRIVEHRNAAGGFRSTQDLLDVPGIGEGRLRSILGAGGEVP